MRPPNGIALCALAAASAAGLSAVALAAPLPRATYLFHDHERPGDGWHVELKVSPDGTRLSQVVLHSERCEATVLARRVAVREGDRVDASRSFTTGDGRP